MDELQWRCNKSDIENKNFKRSSCDSWNDGYEPHIRRCRYQDDSTHHHAFHQNESKYYCEQQIFNNRNNNHVYDLRVNQNNQHIPNEQNKYFENDIIVIDGNLHDTNKIDSSSNQINDECVEHNSFNSIKNNSWTQKSGQTYTNNQCYQEQSQEAKIVHVSITRNLNLQDPRTKLSCIHSNNHDSLYLKVIDRKIFLQNGQIIR